MGSSGFFRLRTPDSPLAPLEHDTQVCHAQCSIILWRNTTLKPLSHLSGQALRASYGGHFLLSAVLRRKHALVSISHGFRPDLLASLYASPICPHISFEHAQNFARVSCGYLHTDAIAKHQHGARKGRNSLVYISLKGSRMAVNLWLSRTSACHSRSHCELFTDRKMS